MENKEQQIIANILVMMENVTVQGADNIKMWIDCKEWLNKQAEKAS